MPRLLVIGGGLFGAQAAAFVRSHGWEVVVFDAGLAGAASPAAAGLFREAWAGQKFQEHFKVALPILDRLYGMRHVGLMNENGIEEVHLFVPPAQILEAGPIRAEVTAVGDGWLEVGAQRYEGYVYIAAGVWSGRFLPDLAVRARSGTSFLFRGVRPGRIEPIARGRQAIAFERDVGTTFFSDGTAEPHYTDEHERASLQHAERFGLTDPIRRIHGHRPYTTGGPIMKQIAHRTWLATGGRKLGTVFGAYFANELWRALPRS